MLSMLAILAIIFGAGFLSGFGYRSRQSRIRRRAYLPTTTEAQPLSPFIQEAAPTSHAPLQANLNDGAGPGRVDQIDIDHTG
jgi:hypothetical protein